MALSRKIISIIIIGVMLALLASCRLCCKSGEDSLAFVGEANRIEGRGRWGLVVVTHGWVERGEGGWPEDMAAVIYERVDSNNWLCGYFDWSGGAGTLNPVEAAEYADEHAGPALAEQILALDADFYHIHFIAHSSGCWAINRSAEIIARRKSGTDIHLTFLDAYVPGSLRQDELGDIAPAAGANYWAEHYYSRDYTGASTEYDLRYAHNVDITAADGGIKDHNFPWQWYHATICGNYPGQGFADRTLPAGDLGDADYGFETSREAGEENWQKSLELAAGNEAVKITPAGD